MKTDLDSLRNLPADKFTLVAREEKDREEIEKISAPSLTYLQDSWRRLKKNKVAIISMGILMVITLIAIFAPFFAPHHYAAQNPQFSNLPPKIPGLEGFSLFNGMGTVGGRMVDRYAAANVPADQYFYLGTDVLGRDLLSRILYGTRISIFIGVCAALFNLVIGVPYGLVSGWMGGKVDNIMMRILEVLSGIPNLVVVILLLLVLEPGLISIIIALGLTEWIAMARLVRAQTLQLKNREYILAARSLGESSFKIALKHLIPNMSGTIIIQTIYSIPSAIFFEAFLSFIGLGIPAPIASLGTLINDGYSTFQFLPHLMWYPAAMISIILIAFNMFANGLRDALDPKTVD
jgi:oligopeptide transport system permease protein